MTHDPLARLRDADPLSGDLPVPLERMPPLDQAPAPKRRWRDTALVVANLVLLATVLLHGLDHAFIQERGVDAISFEVFLGAIAIAAAALFSLVFAVRGDRRAPLVALLVGPWVATLIIVGHFLPDWGEFSDSYEKAGVETVSYVVAASSAAAGLAVAAVALVSTRTASPRTSQ
jgi:hypothetical protein